MTLEKLISEIKIKHPEITLRPAETFYWSPKDNTVYYKAGNARAEGIMALLHESGHALLKHSRYYTDLELVLMEVEAWERAKELAKDFGLQIDEDHLQDCLDSYRDWLHKRSLCPDCNLSGIQIDEHTYSCVFCHMRWKVSTERFCRPYRKTLR